MREAVYMIWGLLGPLMLAGIIGIIYMLYQNKKEKKRKAPREGGMRLSR